MVEKKQGRPKRRLLTNIILTMISCVLALVVGEIILAVFFPVPAFTDLFWMGDGRITGRFIPNQEFLTGPGHNPQFINRKVSYPCSLNRYGFRGDNYKTGRSENKVRFLALGGSSTFCFHDKDEDTWPQRLSRRLEAHFGKQTEMINLGLPGFNAEHAKFNYLAYGRQFKPDVVILYNTWNDLKYMGYLQGNPDRMMYVSPIEVSNTKTAIKRFLRKFQIVRRGRLFYHGVLLSKRYNALLEGNVVENSWYPNEKSWEWFTQNISDLADFTKLDKVILVLSSQGSLISKDHAGDLDIMKYIRTDLIKLDYNITCDVHAKASRIIETVAREKDAVFVDAYNKIPHSLKYFEDHVHLAPNGQKALADVFFETLVNDPGIQELYSRSKALPVKEDSESANK